MAVRCIDPSDYQKLPKDEQAKLQKLMKSHDIDWNAVALIAIGDHHVVYTVLEQRDGHFYIDKATGDVARRTVFKQHVTNLTELTTP